MNSALESSLSLLEYNIAKLAGPIDTPQSLAYGQKQRKDINLPFKKPLPLKKNQMGNLIEKIESQQKGAVQKQHDHKDLNRGRDKSTGRGDNSSRSGSIQGRKMSVNAGVEVILSANNALKHTLDQHHQVNLNSFRDNRDALQRLSLATAVGQSNSLVPIAAQASLIPPSTTTNDPNLQFASFMVTPADQASLPVCESAVTVQSLSVVGSRRGNHNPRQSKEKNGVTKKKLRRSIGQQQSQVQLNPNIRHQHSIRPHVPGSMRPTSSLSKYSAPQNQSSYDVGNQSKSPSRERKSLGMVHSNSQGALISRKQLISQAVKKGGKQTGFQLTFNNKVLSPDQVAILQQHMIKNQNKSMIELKPQKRPQTAQQTSQERIIQYNEAIKRVANKQQYRPFTSFAQMAKSHSSSPPSKGSAQKKSQSAGKANRSSEPSRSRSRVVKASPDDKSNRNSSASVERVIRENLKKQIERSKEKLKQREQERESEQVKKRLVEETNQKIRARNLKNLPLNRISKGVQEPMSHRAVSPRPQHVNKSKDKIKQSMNNKLMKNPSARNFDAPQLLENRERQQEKKRRQAYDLGLEIFELKKELGMPSHRGVNRSAGKQHRARSGESPEKPLTNERETKLRANSASADRRSPSAKRRGKFAGEHMKKLIQHQQKMWLKKIKKQQIGEIMLQQKVFNNLKQLNEVIDMKRKNYKRAEKKAPKTNDENLPPQAVVTNVQDDKKKQVVVNIQVKPVNYDNLCSSLDINHPSTTREQQVIKLKPVKAKKPKSPETSNTKEQRLRPKTAGQQKISFSYAPSAPAKQADENLHKQHQSILTNRSEVQQDAKKKKKKKSKSQNRMILKLIKQIELQQQQINELKQDLSAHKEAEAQPRVKQEAPIKKVEPAKKPTPVVKKPESEKVIVEDKHMVMQVLHTAASLIQQSFREYRLRKQARELALQEDEEQKMASQQLSESLKIEDRIVPVLREVAVQPTNNRRPSEPKRGAAKHTFSFGQGVAEERKHSSQQESKRAITASKDQAELYASQKEESKSEILQKDVEESHSNSVKQAPQLTSSVQSSMKELPKEQIEQELSGMISSRSSISQKIQEAVKINSNVKDALRSIAEKQKKNSIFDLLNKHKKPKKPQAQVLDQLLPTPVSNQIDHKADDDSFLRSIQNQEESGLGLGENDLSKITLDVEDLPNRFRDMPRQIPPASSGINLDMLLQDGSSSRDLNRAQGDIPLKADSKIEFYYQEESKSFIGGDHLDEMGSEVGPLDTEQDLNQVVLIPSHQSNKDDMFEQKRLFEYQSANDPSRQLMGMLDKLGFSNPSHNAIQHELSQPVSPKNQSTYFLQTNASLFDRNPFQEFTTHRLQDLLSQKNLNELQQLREEALQYNTVLEKGMIKRLEGKQQISPGSASRRRFELEHWVSSQKQNPSERPQSLEKLANTMDKIEVMNLIKSVNAKAKLMKDQLLGKFSSLQGSSLQHISQAIHSSQNHSKEFINQPDAVPHAAEEGKEEKAFNEEPLLTLNLEDVDIQVEGKPKEPIYLEISMEEGLSQDKIKPLKANDDTLQSINDISINIEPLPANSEPKLSPESKFGRKADELCAAILQEILLKEVASMKFYRQAPQESAPDKPDDALDQIATNLEEIKTLVENNEQSPEQNDNGAIDLIIELSDSKHIDILQAEEEDDEPSFDCARTSPVHAKPELKSEFSEDFMAQMQSEVKALQEDVKREQEELQQYKSVQLGIDTSDQAIDQYIEEIFEQIRPRKDQFLQAFITPIYKNPLEVLASIQKPDRLLDEDGNPSALSLLDATNSLAYILNVQLYLTLEKAKENLIHETIEAIRKASQSNALDEDMADLMSEAQHIHNKVIFDCVNESLNMVRPFGSQGEPMPWSRKHRKNLIYMYEGAEDLDLVLLQVKNTVLHWAKVRAGALPLPGSQKKAEEDPQIAHARERALALMLAQELLKEEDQRWLDYDQEEAQVKIDLSDIVLDHLIGETVELLNRVQSRQL